MSKYVLVYITTPTEDEARRIGRTLVERRLAACANILPGMKSIYRWQGEVHEENEVVLIVKTTGELTGELTRAVVDLHSYECPCVAVVPISPGNPSYFSWLEESVGGD